MSSDDECLSQRTAFHTAGSHKPIEVKKQSLARVAQLMSTLGQDRGNENSKDDPNLSNKDHEFDGEEIDDDLVFSTVPQRSTVPTTAQIHFDEIDDDEMRRFAESLEQEQQDTPMDDNEQDPQENNHKDDGDDQLCEDYAKKMQTPTKSTQLESKKRKKRCLEDLDALLNDNEDTNDSEPKTEYSTDQQKMSPVFKKKQ